MVLGGLMVLPVYCYLPIVYGFYKANRQIVVLEINGIPGLLESSIACDAAHAAGICFDELCIKYAESAYLPRAEPRIWEGLP